MVDPLQKTTHELKAVAPYFAAVYHGQKTAELRKHDRSFRVGDRMVLCEYSPGLDRVMSGRVVTEITHIVTDADGPWLAEGHCLLSFRVLELVP